MANEENGKKWDKKIATLEKEVKELKKRGGGMLSSSDFLRRVIMENVDRAKKDFWGRKFRGRDFIIDPFNPEQLTPFSYDLAVGEQVYSCNSKRVRNTQDLDDATYWMEPRETIVIKTREFIGLPPRYSATVWPRFKMPVESIFQSMVKIDPTWHGELGIAVTNLSAGKYPVRRGEGFATLILYELTSTSGIYLYRKEDLPDPKGVRLPADLQGLEVSKLLEEHGVGSICQIRDDNICLTRSPNADSYRKLLRLYDSAEWKHSVMEAVGNLPREMQGLGLNTLEIVRPTEPKVQKLEKAEVHEMRCSQMDLENAAIELGSPFHVLPAIPELVMERIEREITPKIQAEVEANVFPKVVTLTLTVLGFLSLIIAIAAFVMDKYRPKTPAFLKIEWSLTATVVVMILGAVLLWAIYRLTHQKTDASRAFRRLEKKVQELEKKNKE